MAVRLGRYIGLACLALVVARLGRVLTSGSDAADWRIVALGAAVVGALVTWTALGYRLQAVTIVALHLTGIVLMVLRVTAAPTLTYGFLPGPGTAATVREELEYAGEILQFGAPPVLAVPGLVALVGVALWLLASTWAWGAVRGRNWLGVVPPLGFYLYLSVMDRAESSLRWNLAFATLAALALLATSQATRPGSGRVRDKSNRPLPRRQAGASVAVLALVISGGLGGVAAFGMDIPGTGTMQWRNPGGGAGGDGVAFNRFVGLRQSLVSLSDDPVFYARVEGTDVDLTRQMYWKLLTLDVFDGTYWRPRDLDFRPVSEAPAWEEPALAYRGPTQRVVQTVAIATLRDDRLPALYSPVALDSEHDVIRSGAEVAPDASLRINALTYENLVYQVESEVPTLDVAALASQGGELTPLFEAAAAEGLFDVGPVDGVTPTRPPAVDAFLQLPSGIDPAVAALAQEVTAGATGPFEAALMLEDFFLQNFDYSTQVSTGHSALDLAAWLNDPDSLNYREGYCEQFATAMGVMGRQLGLPTRVVMGFTPGRRDAETGLTIIRQRNAHAWVEVWLDQAGWVRFDPTPRGDGTTSPTASAVGFEPGAIGLAQTPGVIATDQPGFIDDIPNLPSDDVGAGAPGIGRQALRWPVTLVVLAAMVGVVPTWKILRRRRRRRRAEEDDITAVWEEIVDRLSDLGSPPAPHTTPVEYAAAHDRELVPLAHAYSAAVYGEHRVAGAGRHLEAAERWMDSRYDRRRRLQAAFSLRSLRRR